MIAKVIEKSAWKTGVYPSGKIGLDYRTRQIIFQVEGTNHKIRVNVQTRRPNSMKFNSLKLGDRIKDFKLLADKPIINPESQFTLYSDAALF